MYSILHPRKRLPLIGIPPFTLYVVTVPMKSANATIDPSGEKAIFMTPWKPEPENPVPSALWIYDTLGILFRSQILQHSPRYSSHMKRLLSIDSTIALHVICLENAGARRVNSIVRR